MLKEVVASKAAKIIAACVCPVATTAALTVSVPEVRQAVHKATAPRAYAKPKTRTRQPVQTAAAAPTLPECPPLVFPATGSIAPMADLIESPIPNIDGGAPPPQFVNWPGYPGRSGGPFAPPGGGGGGGNPPGPPITPIPEPATWMQMIIGFGAVGGVTRLTFKQKAKLKDDPEADPA